MSLATLISAHGSPGVTTTALVLAATWPVSHRCPLVEADPFGVIEVRYGLTDTPGLSTLAAQSRRGLDAAALEEHVPRLPGGAPVLGAAAFSRGSRWHVAGHSPSAVVVCSDCYLEVLGTSPSADPRRHSANSVTCVD